ncbi:unnamed protein product [Rhodiola kirilowii]
MASRIRVHIEHSGQLLIPHQAIAERSQSHGAGARTYLVMCILTPYVQLLATG